MAGEYTKRRLFRFQHPDAGPIFCRVVVTPEEMNRLSLLGADKVAGHVMFRAMKFFDITSPKDVKVVDTRDLDDAEDETGNC